MNKLRRFFLSSLMVLGVFSLTACGGGKSNGTSTKDIEKLCDNLEGIYMNIENLDYSKFSLEYKFHDDSGTYSTYYFDESETVKLKYDADGFFHYYSYYQDLEYALEDPDTKIITESYAWVEGSVLTTTLYTREEGVNWENPTKIYWVEDFGTHELALQEFEEWIQSYDILDYTSASDYALNLNDSFLEMMGIYCESKVGNSSNKMKFTINENKELNVDFKIDEVYEKKGSDGYVDDSSDSHWTMVVKDGVITSYTKDETRFNTMGGSFTSDSHNTESYTFTFDWTWEEPDLSTYSNFF